MNKGLLVSILLLLSGGATAQESPDWFLKAIKTETPDQLSYYFHVSEGCPFTEEKTIPVVEGVFIRSRIKPTPNDWRTAPLYLSISIECLSLETMLHPIYNLYIAFGRRNPYPAILYDYRFVALGLNDEDSIMQTLKTSVEAAATEYLRANFDL